MSSRTAPIPTSPAVTTIMKRNRSTDTRPEVLLRSRLHALGYRFRKNLRIKLQSGAVRPDVVFTRQRLAIFIDGCFWHACPEHGTQPQANNSYWSTKLRGNVDRDGRVDVSLKSAGWTVIRVWEHEPPDEAIVRIIHRLEHTFEAITLVGKRR